MMLCDVWFKDIPASTKFDHPYGITIRRGVRLGENCVFASNVTIGQAREEKECSIIGDNVYFGTGSIVLGKIKVGNNALIGANVVITKDIPDNGIFTIYQSSTRNRGISTFPYISSRGKVISGDNPQQVNYEYAK